MKEKLLKAPVTWTLHSAMLLLMVDYILLNSSAPCLQTGLWLASIKRTGGCSWKFHILLTNGTSLVYVSDEWLMPGWLSVIKMLVWTILLLFGSFDLSSELSRWFLWLMQTVWRCDQVCPQSPWRPDDNQLSSPLGFTDKLFFKITSLGIKQVVLERRRKRRRSNRFLNAAACFVCRTSTSDRQDILLSLFFFLPETRWE